MAAVPATRRSTSVAASASASGVCPSFFGGDLSAMPGEPAWVYRHSGPIFESPPARIRAGSHAVTLQRALPGYQRRMPFDGRRSMRSKILVALAFAVVALAGAAFRAIPDGNGVIHACRKV